MRNTDMNLQYGTKLIRKKGYGAEVVYVVSKIESHIVRLSTNFPFDYANDYSFFMNANRIKKVYRLAAVGEQLEIKGTESPDLLKNLRSKHLKQ